MKPEIAAASLPGGNVSEGAYPSLRSHPWDGYRTASKPSASGRKRAGLPQPKIDIKRRTMGPYRASASARCLTAVETSGSVRL